MNETAAPNVTGAAVSRRQEESQEAMKKKTGSSRFRHPTKEYEAVMTVAERRGWRFVQGNTKHFKGFCPCGDHMVMIPLSPSDRRTLKNVTAKLRRSSCWVVDEEA